jgi:hypothetical protein
MDYNHNADVQFSGSHFRTDKTISQSEHGNIYFCPMKCEGEKTYPVAGHCPVCNMNLAPVKEF